MKHFYAQPNMVGPFRYFISSLFSFLMSTGGRNGRLVLFAIVFLLGTTLNAADRYAVATGTWASAATWSATSGGLSGASVPVAGDNVFIEGGFTVTVGATAACANLTINNTSTLSVGNIFTVNGTTSISGILNLSAVTGAKIFIGGVTINSGGSWTESAASTVTFRGGITNNGTFGASTGIHTFDTNAQALSGTIAIPSVTVTGIVLTNNNTLTVSTALAGTGTLTQASNALLSLGGTSVITTLTATATNNTVNYNGVAQTVKVTSYHHLTLSNAGIKTLNASITSVTGNLVMSGTATATLLANLSIGGDLNIGSGTALTLGAFTANGSGTGTLTVAGTLNIGGTNSMPSNYATKIFTGGTVNYNGTAQTVASEAYNNLSLSTSGVKTMPATDMTLIGSLVLSGTVTASLAANIAIGGDLNIGTGTTLTLGTFTANRSTAGGTLTVVGTMNVGGSFPNNFSTYSMTGTVNYNGTGSQTILALTYTNLTISGARSGAITLESGTMNVSGTLSTTATGTTYVTTGNTINLTGAAQTFGGAGAATSFGNIITSGSGIKTSSGNFAINGNLTVGNGTTLASSSSIITVMGTTTIGNGASGSFTTTTGVKTFTGLVTISNGATWSSTTGGLTFKGGITNNGSLTATTGVYTFNTNNQALTGTLVIPSVTVTGVTLTNNGSLTVATALAGTGGLTQGTSATLNLGGTSAITTLTASASGNTVNYQGAAQTVNASIFHHLNLSVSGAKTLPVGLTTINGNLTLGGTSSATATVGLTIGGNMAIGAGTSFSAGNFTHNLKGNFDNLGTFTAGTSTLVLNGTSAQTLTGATTFNKLTVNNSAGVVLANNQTVNSTLTFTSGIITTNANKLVLAVTGSISGAAAGKYINGNLERNYTGAVTSGTFHIGNASTYAPITLTFSNVSIDGTVTANTTEGDHPNLAGSGLPTNRSVNRYWTLNNNGVVFDDYSITAKAASAGEVDPSFNPTNVSYGKYSIGSWSTGTATYAASPVPTFNAALLTSMSDFAFASCAGAGTGGTITACSAGTPPVITLADHVTGEDLGGTWAQTAGTGGTFSAMAGTFDPSGAAAGTHTFTYTFAAAGGCAASTSTVTIHVSAATTVAAAGADIESCATTVTLAANAVAVGEVGVWLISGGAIASPNSPVSTFTGTVGNNYSLTWEITGACGVTSDIVMVNITNNLPIVSIVTATPGSSTAVLNWTLSNVPGVGATYDVYINTSATAPTAGSTPTASGITGLTYTAAVSPGTTYYAWVRGACGATKGAWVGTGMFSTLCDVAEQPTFVSFTSVSTTAATINWTNGGSSTLTDIYITATAGAAPLATTTPTHNNRSGTFYSKTGLISGNTYDVYLRGNCGAGNAFGTAWIGPYTLSMQCASTATALTLTNATATGATVIWTDATASEWEIYHSTTATAPVASTIPTATNLMSPTYTFTGLLSNTLYRYYVRKKCGVPNTNVSLWSAAGTFTTLCANTENPTSGTVVVNSATSATFTWTNGGASTVTDLYVSTSATQPASIVAPSNNNLAGTTYTKTAGLTANTTYHYWLRGNCGASNGNGTEWVYGGSFSMLCATIPTVLTLTDITPTSAIVSWTGGAGEIYMVAALSPAPTNASTPTYTPATSPYSITGLTENTSYDYYVRTTCSPGGNSVWSAKGAFKTLCATGNNPSPAAFTNILSSSASVNWTNNTGSARTDIYISTTNSAPANIITLTAPSVTNATGVIRSITGLTPSTTYYVWIRGACTTTNNTLWVSAGNFTTAVPCAITVPTNPVAVVLSSTSVTLSWTQDNTNGTPVNWDVIRTTTATPPVNGAAPTYNDVTNPYTVTTGLTANTTYYFWVRANCGGGDYTAWSATPAGAVKTLCANPPVMVTSSPTNVTTTSADISWTQTVNTLTAWDLYVSTSSTAPTLATAATHTDIVAPTISASTPYTYTYPLTGLTANTVYFVWARSKCAVGNTNYSAWSVAYTVFVTDGFSTVACPANAVVTPPALTGSCGAYTAALVSTVNTPVSLTCEGTRVYTYRYMGCGGYDVDWKYTYTIDQTTNPAQVGGPVATIATKECIADATIANIPAMPVIKDVCGNTLSPTNATPTPVDVITGCEGTRTFTFNYLACSGLTTSWSFVYTIIDNTAPTCPSSPVTITLAANGQYTLTQSEINALGAGSSDNCNGTLTYAISDNFFDCDDSGFGIANDNMQMRTLTVTDCAGNADNCQVPFVIMPLDPLANNAFAPEVADACSDNAYTLNFQNYIDNSVPSTFEWTVNYGATTGGTLTGAQTSATTSETLNNITGSDVTVVYTVTAFNAATGCEGSTFTVAQIVKSETTTTNQTATICPTGTSWNYDLNLAVTNMQATVFTWNATTISIPGAFAAVGATTTTTTGDFITDNLNNPFNVPVTVTYSVSVVGDNGCAGAPFTVTVTINPPFTADMGINGGLNICSGATRTLDATANGIPPYGYTWAITGTTGTATGSVTPNNAQSTILSVSGQGTVTVQLNVTDANGCTSTPVVRTFTVNPQPAVNAIIGDNMVCKGSSESYMLSNPSNMGATYVWSISSGGVFNTTTTGNTVGISWTGNANTTHSITCVETILGCSTTNTYTVTIKESPTATVEGGTPSCFGGNNGTATASASGGTAPYTYLWTGGQTTATATGLAAGTYTVVVTDANNCTVSATVTLTQPTALTASITTSVHPLCHGGNDGSVTATGNGGTAPYTYLWTGGQTTATATGLAASTYTVVVTDKNGCTTSTSVTLTQPTAVVGTVLSMTSPTCFGGTNGSATITASGGTGPYTYIWPSPITTNSPTATGLAAGTYTVTVQDNNLCSTTVSVVLTAPEALVITPVVVNPVCIGSNGSITLNTTGGTPNYQYSLNVGAFQPSNVFNVGVGTYTVLVKDDANCTATATGIVLTQTDNVPPTITCPPNITTAVANAAPCVATGLALGSATANDNCPNFMVSNNAPTSFPVGTTTVTYTVTQAGAGTTTSATCTQTITVSAAPVSATITSAAAATICVGGSVNVSVNVIATGTYTLVASATNGTTTSTAIVGGAGNGTAAVPFTFTTPGTYTVNLTTLNDAVGCTATLSGSATIIVVEDATISITPTATTVCAGGNINFSAVLNGGDGCTITWESSANLSGPWATVGTGATYTASNILANTYYRAVANCTGSGCGQAISDITQITVVPDPILSITGPTSVCATDPATLIATLTGGIDCTINWESGASASGPWTAVGTPGNTYNTGDLAAGTHYYRAITTCSGNGCAGDPSNVITIVAGNLAATIMGTTTICRGQSANLTINITGSTVFPFTVVYQSNNVDQAPITINSLPYTLTVSPTANRTYRLKSVTDANGCSVSGTPFYSAGSSAVVGVNPAATVNAGNDQTICAGATATLSGTIGGAATSSTWTTSGTGTFNNAAVLNAIYTPSSADITAGSVQLILTTNNPAGICPAVSDTMVLTIKPPFSATLAFAEGEDGVICAGESVAVEITCSGGTAPWTFVYEVNGVSTTATSSSNPYSFMVSPTINTNITLISVVSGNGCLATISGSVDIIVNEAPILSAVTTQVKCFGQSNGAIDLTVTNNIDESLELLTYAWSNSAITQDISGLGQGTYTVTVYAGNDCSTTATYAISQPDILAATNTVVNNICAANQLGSVDLSVTGGTTPYSYLWSNTATTQDISGLSNGNYTVVVTDKNGCTTSTSISIIHLDNTPPEVTPAMPLTIACDKSNGGALYAWLDQHGGATATDNYTPSLELDWSDDFMELSNLCGATGTATVIFTVTDQCGLSSTTSATFTIIDNTPPIIVSAPNATEECGPNSELAFSNWLINHGGATATDACGSVTWSTVPSTPALSDGCGATGTVTVTFIATDDCGNSSSTNATFSIIDSTNPSITQAASNSTAECGPNANAAFTTWLNNRGGATATDVCGSITWSTIPSTPALSDGCGETGTVTVNFIATDDCGNSSPTSATFSITDTTKPSITQTASSSTVECGPNANAAFATWLNNHGGATATDVCSSVTWSTLPSTPALSDGCGETGTVTVNFIATDACGNTSSTSATFSIIDSTNPSITQAASSSTVECGPSASAAFTTWLNNHGGATATDVCGSVTWSTDPGTPALSDGCGATGTVSVIFIASDDCGNSSTTSASFTIVDTTNPSINPSASNSKVECGPNANTAFTTWLNNHGGATATDACGSVTWSTLPSVPLFSDGCGATGAVTVTFIATDDCGNSSTTSATFTIEDTTAPALTDFPKDLIVECDGTGNTTAFNTWLNDVGGARASDACGSITWSSTYTTLSDDCGLTGMRVVTFKATDECGNTTTVTAKFIIKDTTAPTFVFGGNIEDIAVDFSEIPDAPEVTVSDVCGTATVELDESIEGRPCNKIFKLTRTWTATDQCDNSTSTTQIITIHFDLDPGSIAGDQTICADEDPTILTSFDPGYGYQMVSYVWEIDYNGTGFSAITGANAATYDPGVLTPAGTYQFRRILISSGSWFGDEFICASDVSNTVTITVQPLANISVTMSANVDTICAGQPVTFTAIPVNTGINPTYVWKRDGTVIPGANAAVLVLTATSGTMPSATQVANGDSITVMVTPSTEVICPRPLMAVSNLDSVLVKPTFVPSVTIMTNTNPVCPDSSITFVAQPMNGGINPVYKWILNSSVVGMNNDSLTLSTYNANDTVMVIMTPSSEICVSPAIDTSNKIIILVVPSTPLAGCKDVTVVLDTMGLAKITTELVNNGSNIYCGTLEGSVSPASLSCKNVGPNLVILTVTNPITGVLDTCHAIVMIRDEQIPVITCMPSFALSLGGTGTALLTPALVLLEAKDNCGLLYAVSPNMFDCDDVDSLRTVTLTATDDGGNTATCSTTVLIRETVPPVSATCNSSITLPIPPGGITLNAVLLGITDNCTAQKDIVLTFTGNFVFGTGAIGTTVTVMYTMKDEFGNMSTCVTFITFTSGGMNKGGAPVNPTKMNQDRTNTAASKQAVELKVYPSPMLDQGYITYWLPEDGDVNIELWDVNARLIKTLQDAPMIGGAHAIQWQRETLSEGMYFVVLRVNGIPTAYKTLIISRL